MINKNYPLFKSKWINRQSLLSLNRQCKNNGEMEERNSVGVHVLLLLFFFSKLEESNICWEWKAMWVREKRFEKAQRRKIVQISLCALVKQVSVESEKESSQESKGKVAKEHWGLADGRTGSLWFHQLAWIFYCSLKQRKRIIRFVDSSREECKQGSEAKRERSGQINKNNFVKTYMTVRKTLRYSEWFWILACVLKLVSFSKGFLTTTNQHIGHNLFLSIYTF